MNKQKIIQRAVSVHGDKYDYSLLPDNAKTKDKVPILCLTHGVFFQAPYSHFNGSGCPECGKQKNRKSFDQFVKESDCVHHGKYKYVRSSYTQRNKPVLIVCPVHGEFTQCADTHLVGKGCPKCGEKRINITQICRTVDSALTVLKYDEPLNWSSHVTCYCSIHGEFRRRAGKILNGQTQCPGCTQYGFDGTRDATLYCLLSTDIKYMKVGISHNLKVRLSTLRKNTPFTFMVHKVYKAKGNHVQFVEKLIHQSFDSADLTGFDGCTEWLIYDPQITELCDVLC